MKKIVAPFNNNNTINANKLDFGTPIMLFFYNTFEGFVSYHETHCFVENVFGEKNSELYESIEDFVNSLYKCDFYLIEKPE